VVAIDGTPLVGVNVSFLHHNEYGYTISRQDGRSGFHVWSFTGLNLHSYSHLPPSIHVQNFQTSLFILWLEDGIWPSALGAHLLRAFCGKGTKEEREEEKI